MQIGEYRRSYPFSILLTAGLFLLVVTSCSTGLAGVKQSTVQNPGITDTPHLCPQATAEPFNVEPVTSPTTQITQTIQITIGNGEAISVTSEMGSFYAPASAGKVVVVLAPDQINYLTAYGKVKQMGGECHYGGYTLSTKVDRNGNPLTITQGSTGLSRYFLAHVRKDASLP